VITLEAQNLVHLVEKNLTIHDDDLDHAQQKFMHKAMKDSFSCHEGKSTIMNASQSPRSATSPKARDSSAKSFASSVTT